MRPILALALLSLGALPAFPQADAEQVSRHHQESRPAPGETRTVTVGEPVFEEIDQQEYLWGEARTELKAQALTILPKGSLLWAASRDGQATEFCSWGEQGRYCFWDDNGNGTFDRVKIIGGNRLSGISGSYREVWKPGDDTDRNHRYELVYLGAGGGVLRLSMREYRGSSATPVNSNEVMYDLSASGSTRFRYRSVEIEVLSADNSGLRYQVSP